MNSYLNRSSMGAAVLSLLVMPHVPVAGADGVVVRPQDGDSGLFGGTQVERVYRIEGQREVSAVLGWSLVAHRRTLARGETRFTFKRDGVADVSVPLAVPRVNEGVILPAELTVSVYGAPFSGKAATHRGSLWIYPRDPFAGRSAWLHSLDIVLLDPNGKTAAIFDRTGIPYRRVDRPQELVSEDGLAVVGEGLAIDEHAGLAAAAFAAAQRGISVLWLAPASGHFALPGMGVKAETSEGAQTEEKDGAVKNGRPFPSEMAFHDLDVLTELDERLDREIWAASGRNARTIAMRCRQANVVLEFGTDEGRWRWFRVQYAEPAAKLVVCGLPLIARWEESPTPRFLLLRILEHLENAPQGLLSRPND